jgi:ABC-type bacteriocin/lantibiotic exporter with double-glycine peptidase domain
MPFHIIKQQHPQGCIAACAASVLHFHQLPGNWTEAGLLAYGQEQGASGFEKLRNYLRRLPDFAGRDAEFPDAGGRNLQDFVTDVVGTYGPAMMPVQGNPAHCVVIINPDQTGAVVCDPAQGEPDAQHFTWAEIAGRWIGGLLYLRH